MNPAAATPPPSLNPRLGRFLLRLFQSEHLVLILSLIYFGAALPFTPGLASPENAANLLSSLLPLVVLGIGQTFVMITAGIDLSVTSIIALASITGAAAMNSDTGWFRMTEAAVPLGLGLMLGLGAIVGLTNGLVVTRFNMPPFMVTLTTMMFLSGLAIWSTHSQNISHLPAAFNRIGGRTLFAFAITLIIAMGAHVILSRSLFGRWLYAVGQNARAAHLAGVPVPRTVVSAYLVSGICAAVASILYTGRLETGSPVLGQRVLLDVIGATVIGGTSLYGGRGKVLWTLFGALFLTLLDNSLNLLGLSHFTIMMNKGGVILLAAVLDSTRRRLAEPDS